jgi:hypothetical protein
MLPAETTGPPVPVPTVPACRRWAATVAPAAEAEVHRLVGQSSVGVCLRSVDRAEGRCGARVE